MPFVFFSGGRGEGGPGCCRDLSVRTVLILLMLSVRTVLALWVPVVGVVAVAEFVAIAVVACVASGVVDVILVAACSTLLVSVSLLPQQGQWLNAPRVRASVAVGAIRT